tara:strand:+ start:103781 stop:104824 length:1044 start_codon:yes stop_codon:yes gene_type:complete
MLLSKHITQESNTINQALKQLNEHSSDVLLLFVINEQNELVGSLSDGDIRRGLINGIDVNESITKIMFTGFICAEKDKIEEKIKSLNIHHIKLLPVIDQDGKLVEIINVLTYKQTLPIEAIIMAGGKGRRLRPFTKTVPKPLLKVGEKPIIEHNIDRLKAIGIEKIHISIRYLGEQIKTHFGDGSRKKLSISYIEEDEPLGTIGSVGLVDCFSEDTVLLMNSDLLTNIDLNQMYKTFLKQDADLMVATMPYKIVIPYAVIETKDNKITSFKEKPTYTYQSNAGIYLFKKEIVNLIPKDSFFNATDLMEKMIELDKNISYFPILGYWLDIGQHEDYEKAKNDFEHIKF